MSQSQNTSNQVNQEIALPENNEELIRMLGLDEYADTDSGKLVDMIIGNFDNDSTLTSNGIPIEMIQFENLQGYQLVGNSLGSYQQTEIISYVDMSPF